MKEKYTIFWIFFIVTGLSSSALEALSMETTSFEKPWADRFLANEGQVTGSDGLPLSNVRYYARLQGMDVYFLPDRVAYVLYKADSIQRDTLSTGELSPRIWRQRVDLVFEGCSPHAEIEGMDRREEAIRYYTHNVPEGIEGVSSLRSLRYHSVYPGVDVVFRIHDGRLKYDLEAETPQALHQVRLTYRGIDSIRCSAQQLKAYCSLGALHEHIPASYTRDGQPVQVSYERTAEYGIGFVAQGMSEAVRKQQLIVDPELIWSGYIGGGDRDEIDGCTVDQNGHTIVAGRTLSNQLPTTTNAYDATYNGSNDVFITKINKNNNSFYYTYYGSNDNELVTDITTDDTSNIYISITAEGSIPFTSNAYQNTFAGGANDMGFLVFDSSGALGYASLFGGNDNDHCCPVKTSGVKKRVS